uniref:Uncharacterized protein n=1 Tax=Setaria digitata TaxID=48799 RepID=A0A915PUY7_9BILA
MATGLKVSLLSVLLLLTVVSSQEIAGEGLDRHETSLFGKRAKFAFAKRYPSRFAFAKRYDDEDMNYYDKKTIQFESPIRPMRNFAFAKRYPYLLFA